MKQLINLLSSTLLFTLISSTRAQGSSSTPPTSGPTCFNIAIPVTISYTNRGSPQLTDLSEQGIQQYLAAAALIPATYITGSGYYNISARYCEPEVHISSRKNTLQFLVHGLTYTRNYWSGDGAPGSSYNGDTYSWISYASKQGYPTLSIDRLGNGLSDHPDPTLVLQYAAEMETLHQIILAARAGTISSANRKFTKIIYAGHSYGSVLGNVLNYYYPDDVDASILTGYSSLLGVNLVGVFGQTVLLPASIVDPTKYGQLPPGFVEIVLESNQRSLFWAGTYDETLFQLDFHNRGTASLGELATIFFAKFIASQYTRPVYILTGELDSILCNPTGLPINMLSQCNAPGTVLGVGATNYLADTRSLYLSADFEYYAVPDAGHCWQLHGMAQDGFQKAHDWMARKGF